MSGMSPAEALDRIADLLTSVQGVSDRALAGEEIEESEVKLAESMILALSHREALDLVAALVGLLNGYVVALSNLTHEPVEALILALRHA